MARIRVNGYRKALDVALLGGLPQPTRNNQSNRDYLAGFRHALLLLVANQSPSAVDRSPEVREIQLAIQNAFHQVNSILEQLRAESNARGKGR